MEHISQTHFSFTGNVFIDTPLNVLIGVVFYIVVIRPFLFGDKSV